MTSTTDDPRRPTVRVIGCQELTGLFAVCTAYRRLLVAVSGGADSMALMHLLHDWVTWRQGRAPGLVVATVDHGLRAESDREAQWIGQQARALGLPHVTLPWLGDKPRTGIQQAARAVRQGLLIAQARQSGCDAVLLAHTKDDQAETVLMRLARGSGADGLAAMQPVTVMDGVPMIRPLLGVPKARLMATLRARGAAWIEDPSNSEGRFERVRLRGAGQAREALGLSKAALAATARRLSRARQALDQAAAAFLMEHAHHNEGAFCRIAFAPFRALPEEIALRVLRRAVSAHGGQAEAPRLVRLEALLARLRRGSGAGLTAPLAATLGGCHVTAGEGALDVIREPGRLGLPEVEARPGEPIAWDRRFQITIDSPPDGWAPIPVVRALGGDGLRQLRRIAATRERGRSADGNCARGDAEPVSGTQFARAAANEWGLQGLPRRAWLGLPSVWSGPALLAVPYLGRLPPSNGGSDLPGQGLCRSSFIGEARLCPLALGTAPVG